MAYPNTSKHEYDNDPEIRRIERLLEARALRTKVSTAQQDARNRLRRGQNFRRKGMLVATGLLLLLVGSWLYQQRASNAAAPLAQEPVTIFPFADHLTEAFSKIVQSMKNGDWGVAAQDLMLLEHSGHSKDAFQDTLAYLKGISLLKQNHYRESVNSFMVLDAPGKPWREEAQFSLFQLYMLLGEKESADQMLEKMRQLPGHRYYGACQEWLQTGKTPIF